MGGWLAGKSDVSENPVVSLDLDSDFGLRLRVCQLGKLVKFLGLAGFKNSKFSGLFLMAN